MKTKNLQINFHHYKTNKMRIIKILITIITTPNMHLFSKTMKISSSRITTTIKTNKKLCKITILKYW